MYHHQAGVCLKKLLDFLRERDQSTSEVHLEANIADGNVLQCHLHMKMLFLRPDSAIIGAPMIIVSNV